MGMATTTVSAELGRPVDRPIDALPGPAWVPYAIVSVVVGLAVHAAAWIDGLPRAR